MASTASLIHGLSSFLFKKIITQGQNIVLQILSKINPPPGEKSGGAERNGGFGERCLFG